MTHNNKRAHPALRGTAVAVLILAAAFPALAQQPAQPVRLRLANSLSQTERRAE